MTVTGSGDKAGSDVTATPPGQGEAAPGEPEQTAAAPGGPREPGASKKSGWRESVLLVSVGVVAALLVHFFVVDSVYIPSESMEQTLLINDRVVVDKLSGDVGRGEVVVFKGWDGTTTIKRVIGVGGDRVKCCDAQKRVTVNGVPLDEESYLHPQDFPSQERFDVTVPKGRLWLMGDHRASSEDSRAYRDDGSLGTISTDDVVGRAFALYWPLSRMATLPVPETFSKVR
ncbi:signal peptidase I [Sphaerisporangium sp. TRM90804]|uniref:signal peptidase I n=1 Tax=Sphaerisporangium sp. TRM90804 TaxID=3031113 RepID=UPI00244725F0|nr:signal peptidase I [Sphaerisporangium sp. TRM90804]MDH2430098.1 signal peptidase I [Sphaerisporangium sp. TRM90804]